MRLRCQLVTAWLALTLGTAMAVPASAQRGHVAPPPAPHRAPAAQKQNPNRPPQRQQENKEAQQRNRQGQGNPPRENRENHQNVTPRENDPNRPPASYNQQPLRKFSELSPQDKQKVLDNNRKLQNLSPNERQELNRRAQAWNRLTPEQKNHIKNDVLPKWRTMPMERRQAIRQRLQILQNMPESAKNERLNDPNFTRGMSEEDRQTLRDLSHLHVGGPPDTPLE
jgi:hypothetical protein